MNSSEIGTYLIMKYTENSHIYPQGFSKLLSNDDVVFSILLTLLPNLKEIVVHQLRRSFPFTTAVVSNIAKSYAAKQNHLVPVKKHPLAKLSSFRHWIRGIVHANSLPMILPFTLLPSVNTISGSEIYLEPLNDESPAPFPIAQPSHLERLIFAQSTIAPAVLPFLLEYGNVRTLKTFLYEVEKH
jgi:hypothetical protein